MGSRGDNRWAVRRVALAVALIAATIVIALPTSAATPRWAVVHTPSPPGPPNGALSGVACWDANNCLAIGANDSGVIIDASSGAAAPHLRGWNGASRASRSQRAARFRRWNGAGCATPADCLRHRPAAANGHATVIIQGPAPLLERWNGTTWSLVPGPTAPANSAIDLVALTCPAANDCFAVGSLATVESGAFVVKPAVLRWNGSTWSLLPVPKPSDSPESELNAIACASPTSCVAVGDKLTGNFYTDNVQTHAFIEQWDGAAWTLSAFTKPVGSAQEFLAGVSCADASNCLAVGAYLSGTTTAVLVEQRSGTTWSPVAAPIPPGHVGANLIDVACTAATACIAVGDAFVGTTGLDPLAEHWNGSSFSIDTVASVAGADIAGLFGIACTSATDCSAVGSSVTLASNAARPLNEHWNGTSWSIATSPAVTPYTELDDVACPTATACFAIGDSTVVERWNGSSWSLAPLAANSSQSLLADVACSGANDCVTVGLYSNTAGPQALAEHGNGTFWKIVAVPNAAGATNAALLAVDCVNAHDCTAVGGAGDEIGPRVSLVEHWNGTSWSVVPSPNPAGAQFVELLDVSCSSSSSCNAIGDAVRDGTDHPFGAHWNGVTWSLDTIPTSAFAEFVALPSLSCPRPNSCFAVGSYQVVTGDRHVFTRILMLHWNGQRWVTIKGATIPFDPTVALLSTVSCSSANQCLAVGLHLDQVTGGGILNERWDGRRWTAVDGGRALRFIPTGLACRSGISCYAVGSGFSLNGTTPAVAHWNGARWVNVTTGNPSGALRASLSGVDCPLRTVCFAAGFSQTALGSFTLVVRGT